MLMGVQAIGSDVYNYGAKTVGSVLLSPMKVEGS
jgi:PmbA protein